MVADIIFSDVKMRSNAMHEAAHAVMCLMKNVRLGNVEIYESPRNGCFGVCWHGATSHWSEEVWIALAAPIVTAFHEKTSYSLQYSGGGSSDFRKAYSACLTLIAPIASAYGVELNLNEEDLENCKRCSGPTFRRDQGGANLPDRMIGRTVCVYARPYA